MLSQGRHLTCEAQPSIPTGRSFERPVFRAIKIDSRKSITHPSLPSFDYEATTSHLSQITSHFSHARLSRAWRALGTENDLRLPDANIDQESRYDNPFDNQKHLLPKTRERGTPDRPKQENSLHPRCPSDSAQMSWTEPCFSSRCRSGVRSLHPIVLCTFCVRGDHLSPLTDHFSPIRRAKCLLRAGISHARLSRASQRDDRSNVQYFERSKLTTGNR